MSEGPWFKFFASDWIAGVGDLTAAERGVYITLLAAIYDKDGNVRYDEARLARLCGCPKAAFRRAFEALVAEGKLSVVEGKVSNQRAKSVLTEREIRSEKARASAQARWNQQEKKIEQNQSPPDAIASEAQCERTCDSDANQKPDTRSQKEEGGGGGGSAGAREADPEGGLTEREELLEAMGHHRSGLTAGGKLVGNQGDMAEAARWAGLGLSHRQQLDAIRGAMAAKRDGAPSSFRYFTPIMTRLAGELSRPPLAPEVADGRPAMPPAARAWTLDPSKFNDDGSRRQ